MRSTRNHVLEQRAVLMRRAPTASEAALFAALGGRRLGVSFRRQVPLAGRYIADFYASELRLVVEVDGGYHAERGEADARRDRVLARGAYHVLRLEAGLVMADVGAAVGLVREEIARLRAG